MATEPGIAIEAVADDSFIDRVHDGLDELFRRTPGVGDEDAMLFRLAVSEVATNVVAHASSREPVRVTVELDADETALSAVFSDTAEPALIDLDGVSMPGEDWIRPAPAGPSPMPTRMKPAAAGRRIRLMPSPQITAAANTRARAVRVSCMRISGLGWGRDRTGAR